MKIELLGKINEVDVFGLSLENESIHPTFDIFQLHDCNPDIFALDNFRLLYRSVSYDRWNYVKKNGVDVFPTDSVIYCDCLEKASEYGKWPKVIMGFDPDGLDRTFREVDSNIDNNELKKLLEIFPSIEKSIDGSKFWLSRLSLEDVRRASAYETNYAKWISGDPWGSLKVIILADLNQRKWVL